MAEIEYPKNINVSGLMAFPIYSEGNITQLEKWRVDKGIGKPRYPDRISITLLLNQKEHDKVVTNLKDVYLPFAATLQAETDKKKGIDPKLIAKLSKLVADEDWSESNLPIRNLNDKDEENLAKNGIENIVSKLKVAGPPQNAPFSRKAIMTVDGESQVVSLPDGTDELYSKLGEQTDIDRLWWGASWPFKTNIRFNAFNAANFGVTAYGRTAYLLADHELRTFGTGDADVLADGDDWSDD